MDLAFDTVELERFGRVQELPEFSLNMAKELRIYEDNIVCEGISDEICNNTVLEITENFAAKVMTFEDGWFFDQPSAAR